METADWRDVTTSSPCPICEKPDWCSRTGDGAIHCRRITDPPSGWRVVKRCPGGGTIYRSEGDNHRASRPSQPPTGNGRKVRSYPSRDTAIEALTGWSKYEGAVPTEYRYTDEFSVVRFDLPGSGKDFRPVSLHADGWHIADPMGILPLYHANDLGDTTSCVFVVEGEKCADEVRRLGLTAVTSAHGSKSAARSDWQPLAGSSVVILPDNDKPGRCYAEDAANILTMLDPPATVKIIALPNLPAGGDVVDWVEAHDSRDDDELRRMLDELIEATPEYRPTQVAEPDAPLEWKPFPTRLLPEPVRAYVSESARAIGVDESYIGVAMLGALAGSIGTTHSVRIKQDYFQPPILWTMFVGQSGTMKDAALESITRVIHKEEIESTQAHAAAMAEWANATDRFRAELKTWEKETASKNGSASAKPERPTKPVGRRFVLDDITIEALACVLEQNPRGVLAAYPEMTIWFRGMGEHKGGRGSDDAKWIKTYDASMLSVDRKNIDRPRVFVPHPAVSVIGGIQPGILTSELLQRRLDGGLIARFWIVYPPEDNVVQLSDYEVSPKARDNMEAVFLRLLALKTRPDGTPHVVKLAPEAWSIFREYIQGEHTRDINNSVGHLRSAYAKDKGRVARLALILHLVKTCRHNYRPEAADVINPDTMREAVDLVRWFKRETARVYRQFLIATDNSENQRLLGFIRRRDGSVTPSDVVRGCSRIVNVSEATEVLDGLVEAGHGQWENPAPGPDGGRPTKVFRMLSQGSCSAPVYETSTEDNARGGCVDVDRIDAQETNDDARGHG